MNKNKIKLIIILTLLISFYTISAQDKLAQTGFQFLSVATDARGGAMADAMTTVQLNSSSLFFNPAGMARMKSRFDINATQNNWIADIKHNSYTMAIRPAGGRFGVIGLSFMSVDYGEIQGTMAWGNDKGYVKTEVFEPSAYALGIGYASILTDKFAVGGHVKYAGQQLGRSSVPVVEDSLKVKRNKAYAVAYDFGTIYRTGYKSLKFGMSVRNFSNEIKYETESFLLPLTFRIGISMDLMDLVSNMDNHILLTTIDATHPRSYPEQLKFGMQYGFMNTFFARIGYNGNSDQKSMTYGFGIKKFGAAINYAYTPYGIFGDVQRFSINFQL